MIDKSLHRVQHELLAEVLARQGELSALQALAITIKLAQQLRLHHAAGRVHLAIGLSTVFFDAEGDPELRDVTRPVQFGGSANDADLCPPEFGAATPLAVPRDLPAASVLLNERGIDIAPCQIDLYQLGSLLCRMLTGQAAKSYLRSPRTKESVPAKLRPLIERAIGCDGVQRFVEAGQFIDAAEASLARLSEDRTDFDEFQQESPGGQVDTTPSIASSVSQSDTFVARRVTANPLDDDVPFQHLGHYEILSRIGHGGMGDVYKGYEAALKRTVAIKVLPHDLARQKDFVRRFHDEASAAARLTHPNIIQIHYIGEDQGHHFFAMQYVDGESLAALLARRGRLAVEEALAIAEQALSALAAAHKQRMVHRDIKPGNILIDQVNRRAVVADFGLVKSLQGTGIGTATGVIMGTVDYISPEQGRGEPVDGRSDLYSIGVLMYQMLTGRLPFEADSPTAMVFQHVYKRPRPLTEFVPGLPVDLARVVAKLMSKSPEDRPQSADAVLADLRALRDGRGPLSLAQPKEPESSDVNADGERSRKSIVLAPRFDDIEPLPSDLIKLPKTNFWGTMRDRAMRRFRVFAPQFVEYLQNTQQQVDGAVAEYSRRQQALSRLLLDAEQARNDLAHQLQLCRSAVEATCDRDDTAEIEALVQEQDDEIESLRVSLASVTATLLNLRSQRDHLNARLKMAQAKAQVAGTAAARRLRWQLMVVSTLGIVALATTIYGVVTLAGRNAGAVTDTSAGVEFPLHTAVDVNDPGVYLHPIWKFGDEGKHGERIIPFPKRVNSITFKPRQSENVGYEFVVGDDEGIVTQYFVFVAGHLGHTRIVGKHAARIHAVAYSPDGRFIASAADDATLALWHYERGQHHRRLIEGPVAPIRFVAFSLDGQQLLTVGQGGAVRMWDVNTGQEMERQVLSQRQGTVTAGAWTYDGREFLLGGDRPVAHWMVAGMVNDRGFPDSSAGTTCLAISARADTVSTLTGNSIHVWDFESGKQLRQFGHGLGVAAFAPTSHRVWTANRDRQLQLWSTRTGELITQYGGHEGTITSVAVSANGRKAASYGGDDTIRIWDLPAPAAPPGQLHELVAAAPVNAVAFSPDGRLAASADRQGLTVWDVQRGKSVYPYELNSNILAVDFSPTGDRVLFATGQENSVANYLGIKAASDSTFEMFKFHEQLFQQFRGHGDAITAARYTQDGRRAVSASRDGTVTLWDVQTGTAISTAEVGAAVNCLVMAGNTHALLAAQSNNAELWDLERQVKIREYAGHSFLVLDVATSNDGKHAASASADHTVRVWDVETGAAIATFIGHRRRVNAVAISNDGQYVLSAGDDGALRYWRVGRDEMLCEFEGHAGPVRDVAISPNGSIGLSAGDDRKLRFWQLP